MSDEAVSEEFTWIDEPKDWFSFHGKKLWYPECSFRQHNQGEWYYLLWCENQCCQIEIPANEGESLESAFARQPEISLECEVMNKDGSFKQSWVEKCEREKNDPLNNPNLSREEKLAYVDSRKDWDEDFKWMMRESVNYEASM